MKVVAPMQSHVKTGDVSYGENILNMCQNVKLSVVVCVVLYKHYLTK